MSTARYMANLCRRKAQEARDDQRQDDARRYDENARQWEAMS